MNKNELMIKFRLFTAMIIIAVTLSACATLQERFSNEPGRITTEFFNDLQKSDRQAAYNLFGKGLSETLSFNQFDELIASMETQWGKIQDSETVLLPFHQRLGEDDFIPLGVPKEKIKRFTFEVQFRNAIIDCDLTLAQKDGQYKIVWISFWGSDINLAPAIQEKFKSLSYKPPEE